MTRRITSLILSAATLPALAAYDLNFPADSHVTHGTRALSSVSLNVTDIPAQTLQVGQQAGGNLYFDLTDRCLVALPGAKATVSFAWTGTWMNSYVYIDRADDGSFDSDPAGDLIAFSNLDGTNSAGASSGNGDVLAPPAFAIPANLAPGLHRMRVKIDWDDADPAGSTADGNDILKNGGAIVDVMLLIPDSDGTLKVTAHNGTLTLADGTPADGAALPASGPVALTPVADSGYIFDALTATCGFSCPDPVVTFAEPSMAGSSTTYTAPSLRNGVITIPRENLTGAASVEAFFIAHESAPGAGEGRYSSPYAGDKPVSEGFTAITLNGTKAALQSTALHQPAAQTLNLQLGSDITLGATFSGSAAKFNFYIDLNQDGEFNANTAAMSCELLASAASLAQPLTASLPENIPAGVYRARLEAEGHSDVDFFLNVHNPSASLRVQAMNALVLSTDHAPLPDSHAIRTSLRLRTSPTLPGFTPAKAIVRHGQNLSGPEFVCGNPQWADYEARILSSGTINVPASVVDGDLEIFVIYEEGADSEWIKVWGDEFNSGTFDTRRWQYQPRQGATWNRLVAQGARQQRMVNTFEDGCYNSHCIPTPDEFTTETQPMISGAIMSQGKFSVKFGKIEARIKTNPHTGNFPAFWMMPAYSELTEQGLNGWPMDGEIDIWEQIDAQNRAHHTVHSGWTGWNNYCHWEAPQTHSPASTSNENCDATLWHVYAIEWDAEEIRWFMDGNQVFSYRNQHYSEPGSKHYIEKVTWPFDKHFYIILNQSVGNGSWAAGPDTSFHYLTQFDYVRVYQKKAEQAYESTAKDNGDDPDFYIPAKGTDDAESSIVDINADASTADGPVEYFDLNGRRVAPSALTPGIYIEKQGPAASKIIIR